MFTHKKKRRNPSFFSYYIIKKHVRALELYSATLRENEADEEGMIGLARTHLKRSDPLASRSSFWVPVLGYMCRD